MSATVSDAWIDFLAGWCSGAVSVLALQPLDTVLTRWQAVAHHPSRTNTTTTSTSTRLNLQTSLQVARSLTTRAGSWRSLWRGASPMIGAVPFQNALLMGGYGVGQNWAGGGNGGGGDDDSANKNYAERLTAIFVGGCTGGVLQSFLMSPVELVKVSTQVQPAGAPPLSVRQLAVKLLVASPGNVRTGLGATLLRDGIPHGVWFVSYEACKNYLQQQQQMNSTNSTALSSNMLPPLAAGAFAATVAWAVGYPADLIKTRIQAGVTSSSGSGGGIIETANVIVEEHGGSWRGLYRGFGMKLVRAIPASMIGFGTYEFVKGEIVVQASSIL